MRTIKRIIKIHKIDGYKIYCLFNNGESRIVDFQRLFKLWNTKEGDFVYPMMQSLDVFQQVEVIDGTFTWKNIKIESTDEHDNPVTHFLDLDPIVMYESSVPDPNRQIHLGLMIKQTRKELGLTQQELAAKSGTSKHYISKIENNKSGIELSTLIRIIEGGLGKRLELNIV